MLTLIAIQTVWIYWINTVPGQVSPSAWSQHRQVPIGASIALVISCSVCNWSILCLLNIPKWNGSNNLRQFSSSQLVRNFRLFLRKMATLFSTTYLSYFWHVKIYQNISHEIVLLLLILWSLLSWLHVSEKFLQIVIKPHIGLFVTMLQWFSQHSTALYVVWQWINFR